MQQVQSAIWLQLQLKISRMEGSGPVCRVQLKLLRERSSLASRRSWGLLVMGAAWGAGRDQESVACAAVLRCRSGLASAQALVKGSTPPKGYGLGKGIKEACEWNRCCCAVHSCT